MPLIYASEWYSVGGIDPEVAAAAALEMFNQYLDSGNDGECGDMACCETTVIIHRFNPISGRPEISTDGGVTWTPDPQDIQNQIMLYPPIVSPGGKTKCDAATNASEHINELITATGENLDTASTIFELAVAVAGAVLGLFLIIVSAGALTAPVTAVVTTIWAAATGAFELGIAAYNAYWTVDKQDAILCALFCNIGSDGQFTEAQYQSFYAKVKEQLPASPALDIILTAINAGGARGLSQMASYGNAALADCDSCDCSDCIIMYDANNPDVPIMPSETCDIVANSFGADAYHSVYLSPDPSGAPVVGTTFKVQYVDIGGAYTTGYYDTAGTIHAGVAIPINVAITGMYFEKNVSFTVNAIVVP
jgi:hypothetical protein